jgi:hypothetical protein
MTEDPPRNYAETVYLNGLIEEKGLANIFDFGNCTFEVKGFSEDDFEDLEARVSTNYS